MDRKKANEVFLRDVYHPYHQDVYQYCIYLTNNPEEAKDLTQDTFMKALNSIDQEEGKSNVRTWIMSIARYTTIDYFRKKRYERLLPNKWLSENKSEVFQVPESDIEKDEEWFRLQKALLKLKENYRQVVILRALKEFTVSETAEILGWTESKVRVTYHRAIQNMRKKLN